MRDAVLHDFNLLCEPYIFLHIFLELAYFFMFIMFLSSTFETSYAK